MGKPECGAREAICGEGETECGMRSAECGKNARNSEFRIPHSEIENPKKHPCPDCRFCQWCSDDRCHLCLGCGKQRRKKLSQEEQIALYESLNREKGD